VKTVLFAWELGAGAGHLVNIRRLAQRLQQHDVRIVAAVTRLDSIALLDNIQEIHRVPDWPDRKIPGETPSSATMTDNFVGAGLNDASAVHDIVAAWDRLFRLVNPSLVIADYAPGASLAARHRYPLMHIGSGYTLPPHDMDVFPPLHDFSPLVHRDEDTMAAINDALRRLGLRELERLPQVFAGDGRLVYSLPAFDPYVSRRSPPADGLLIDYKPRARDADAQDVFVYISGDTEVRPDVIAAIRPVANRVRIHAPMLGEETQRELVHAGAEIVWGHIALSEALPRCRLVVHLGSVGFACEAALAGVPQLSMVTHVERHLTGIALERAGIGRVFLAYDPARQLAADAIESMVHDEALARQARETAERLRSDLPEISAGEKFDAECRRLLG
jgi:hypothetical protein